MLFKSCDMYKSSTALLSLHQTLDETSEISVMQLDLTNGENILDYYSRGITEH